MKVFRASAEDAASCARLVHACLEVVAVAVKGFVTKHGQKNSMRSVCKKECVHELDIPLRAAGSGSLLIEQEVPFAFLHVLRFPG